MNGVTVEPVGEVVAGLGEGPHWDGVTNTLLWVDIPGGLVHRTDPVSGQTSSVELGTPVSMVLPTASGALLVARRNKLVLVDARGGGERVVAELPAQPSIRFNDGKCDPRGRLWLGTMHTEREPEAALYRLDFGGALSAVLTGITVSNGLGWSPDGRTMYYADTPTLRVDAFDYDLDAGVPSGRRPFADLSGSPGRPDGLTVDADGGVWVACVRGGELRHFTPDGQLAEVLRLPVSAPTSCAFGGESLDRLFVTSALDLVPEQQRADQSLAGHLLTVRPGATGKPEAFPALES